MDGVLVLNAGSSSIKFSVYEPVSTPEVLRVIVTGQIAQVGARIVLRARQADGSLLEDTATDASAPQLDHEDSLTRVLACLARHDADVRLIAIGHRVVHGGALHTAPARVSEDLLRALDALAVLAPLHQPHNLRAIRILRKLMPEVVQVACFDTAFHSTQAWVEQAFALPRQFSATGVRRYGFHGLSYEYIASQLPRVLGPGAGGKVIVAHLGNGASLCGLLDGHSVASTMGFSALDGLMMGTRSGSIDAGAVLYLLEQLGLDVGQVSDLLYRQSGLLGVSGISSDMQVLLASQDPHALEAIQLFVYRIVLGIGTLAAALGGLDALVFTAGIGERAAQIRARVCRDCAWLGARLDQDANLDNRELIHAPSSALSIAVIPTDEARIIGLHTLQRIGHATWSKQEC
jgi:acetate kinase